MRRNDERSGLARIATIALAIVIAGTTGVIAPSGGAAHFVLEEPASWRGQDALGDPQKLGPCGDDGSAAETGAITAYQTGQTISITIRETIFHPGHYRIALSVNDRSELPEEPLVTAGTTPCGSVPIMDPPVFPVLADGVLAHTSRFSGAQTIEVTLPPGVTCDHCTLQVIEFMSNHGLNTPGGCFYHHCADISIQDVVVDAGTSTADAGSMDAGAMVEPPQGCACSTPGHGTRSSVPAIAILSLAMLTLVALVVRRRRAPR